ncbi:MAG: hypothetical protein AAFV53_19040 [Myxococcota bacterium]
MLEDALRRRAQPAVSSLTEAIVARQAGVVPDAQLSAQTAAAMASRIAQMSPHLQIGMFGLTTAFSAYARARTGQSLRTLSIPQRQQLLDEWRASPIGPCRQFVQFFEKMGSFLYYSLLEESLMPPHEVR